MPKESKPTVVKRTSIGGLTISVQGLRHVADCLEKSLKGQKDVGDVVRQHYIVQYSNAMKTIGVEMDDKIIDQHGEKDDKTKNM